MNQRIGKLLTTCMLLATIVPGTAAAESEPAPIDTAEVFEAIPEALLAPTTSQTNCDFGRTICATAIAVASVVCTRPFWPAAQCTGAGTIGGHGVSPVGLPGVVSWSGSSSCSSCAEPSYRSASGQASWPGANFVGAGTQSTLGHGTKSVVFGCVNNYRVTASVGADARTSFVFTLTSVGSSTSHQETRSICY